MKDKSSTFTIGIDLGDRKHAVCVLDAKGDRKEHSDMLALIEPSLCVLDAMTEQIRKLEKSIAALAAEKYPESEFLSQVGGVGPLTAAADPLA